MEDLFESQDINANVKMKKKSTCLFSTSTGKKLCKDVDKYVFGITDCGDFCKVTRLSNSIGVQAQVIQYVFHGTVS